MPHLKSHFLWCSAILGSKLTILESGFRTWEHRKRMYPGNYPSSLGEIEEIGFEYHFSRHSTSHLLDLHALLLTDQHTVVTRHFRMGQRNQPKKLYNQRAW